MKKESELFQKLAPKVGSEFIKLKSGKVVRWDAFDEKRQVFEFRAAEGEICTVHRRDIEFPTSEEELQYLATEKPS
jgi:hypothetical protein